MAAHMDLDKRTRIEVKIPQRAVKDSPGRRFQGYLEPKEILSDEELAVRLAQYGYDGNVIQASRAIQTIESFVLAELAKGNRLDFGLTSFYPRLSQGLTTRDADPESEGAFVRGAVKARRKLEGAISDKARAVNPLAKKFLRLDSVYNKAEDAYDVVTVGDTLSVCGHDIGVKADRPDEGFWLEKRDGRLLHKPKPVARAELLSTSPSHADIVFREPIPRGKYNLVCVTRCGESLDYKPRRIGHPVRVE